MVVWQELITSIILDVAFDTEQRDGGLQDAEL